MRGETIFGKCCDAFYWHFNPLPSCEGRLDPPCQLQAPCKFQSTPLMRGETARLAQKHVFRLISIHSPHARGDFVIAGTRQAAADFNPLPSCEGRRRQSLRNKYIIAFQSTPLMRGETPARVLSSSTRIISIHSPHARGDHLCPR